MYIYIRTYICRIYDIVKVLWREPIFWASGCGLWMTLAGHRVGLWTIWMLIYLIVICIIRICAMLAMINRLHYYCYHVIISIHGIQVRTLQNFNQLHYMLFLSVLDAFLVSLVWFSTDINCHCHLSVSMSTTVFKATVTWTCETSLNGVTVTSICTRRGLVKC